MTVIENDSSDSRNVLKTYVLAHKDVCFKDVPCIYALKASDGISF